MSFWKLVGALLVASIIWLAFWGLAAVGLGCLADRKRA